MFTELLDLLTAPHGFDRYAELVAPRWSRREIRARVEDVRRETADSVTLTLRPNRHWRGHRAGQHTQLTVEIDGVRHTRCYSVSSSEHRRDGRLELTVKAQPGGAVSPHLVRTAAPGLVVGLTPAAGDFTLPAARPERLLLISGGSGITPVLSMLRTLCDEGHDRPVAFLHYCLTRADQIAAGELDALAGAHPNVRLLRVFVDEPGAGDLDGLFSGAHLDAADPAWSDALAYVCGPAPLMAVVQAHYRDAGLDDRVRVEAFTLPQLVAEQASVAGSLQLAASGLVLENDGRPILDQAEAAGLTPAHGCRMGICHTCTRTLCSGSVRNLVDGSITAAAGTPVRICVNTPLGDAAIDL